MITKKQVSLILLLFFLQLTKTASSQENDDVKLLEDLASSVSIGVNTKDHNLILNAFIHPSALIYSTHKGSFNGEYSKELNTAQGLSDFIKNSDKEIRQTFEFVKVEKVSEGRAIVTTYYYVTIDGQKSHKGDELYSAIKTKNGWKFVSLIFTLESWTD